MPLKIVQTGERVLRENARPLSIEEIRGDSIQQVIEAMKETMYAAPGVGLAAPQIGLALQLAVIEDRPEYTKDISAEALAARGRRPVPFHVVINPRIVEQSGQAEDFFEGCLSVAGFSAVVPRAHNIVVECLNEKAEPVRIQADGWYARILQHEIDHLNGILYIDRMITRSFTTMENFNHYWKDGPVKSW